MSEPIRVPLYASRTIEPFAPVPTFTPNGEPRGWLTWPANANVAVAGEILIRNKPDGGGWQYFSPESALADALAEKPSVFGFMANRCPRCHGETVVYDDLRWEPCPDCGGSGRLETTGAPS
jgi:hypothetical protein